jgi:hypothetical protein
MIQFSLGLGMKIFSGFGWVWIASLIRAGMVQVQFSFEPIARLPGFIGRFLFDSLRFRYGLAHTVSSLGIA